MSKANPQPRYVFLPSLVIVVGISLTPLVALPVRAAGWTEVAPMSMARDYHTATLLPSGKVLVTGGRNGAECLSSAEIYDPHTAAWTPVGSLHHARFFHTASLLSNGKILVVGGYDGRFENGVFSGGTALSIVELYDPEAQTWSVVSPLHSARILPTATLLRNGRVLIAGGGSGDGVPLSSTEVYDPATGNWTRSGEMKARRLLHTATLLPGGTVLIAGGSDAGFPYAFLSSAEIYDPGTGTWNGTSSMGTRRFHFTATLLPDGKVLVAGGQTVGYGPVSGTEVFDPAIGSWTAGGSLVARYLHTATLLADGQVLVVGGEGSDGQAITDAELFNPATSSWVRTESLDGAHAHHRANLLSDGSVLVTGGTIGEGTPLARAAVYGSTRPVTPPPTLVCTMDQTSCRISFRTTIGALFTARATSDIALPSEQWSGLGLVMEVPPGRYEFEEVAADRPPARYYQVSATGFVHPADPAPPPSLVLIPSGTFPMGDSLAEGSVNDRPVHDVAVSAFFVDRTEVTKALWDEVRTWALAHGYSFGNAGSGTAATHPVHTVNWYDVVKWCNARSEKEGRVPAYYTSGVKTTVYRTGQVDVSNDWVRWDAGYRLPTEAEWECAARGGLTGKRFPWGDTISHSQANYHSTSEHSYDVSPTWGGHPTYAEGDLPYTSPVGSLAANGYGLYDMAGNVWEWCWDWYAPYGSGAKVDPRGPSEGSNRVLRGGSWAVHAWYCRVAHRGNNWSDGSFNNSGFRSVLPARQ